MRRNRIITVTLSKTESIERAIQELEKYRDSIIEKNELFVKRLADIGVNAALMTLATKGQGDAERDAQFSIVFNNGGEVVNGRITISSEPKVDAKGRTFYPHLAWEFGAGTEFNGSTSPNPKAKEFGLGPGTYPNQTHVPEPGFWYYRDEYGDAVRSYGTQATMPMYTASLEIINNIELIAREVFGG